ncbi:MAG: transporter substrate-binding domain-containing protein [Desulfamplus sp.]|nr:transporter substrate-binding domain-containing protein [Desulfamplus sp.]
MKKYLFVVICGFLLLSTNISILFAEENRSTNDNRTANENRSTNENRNTDKSRVTDKKSITVASEEWENATRSDGKGLYWDIIRVVFEPEGYKVVTTNKSYVGSVSMMKKKTVDAMVGAYEGELEDGDGIYPENHFAMDVVQAVYQKGKIMEWKGLNSIKNSTVAWIKGYSYDDYFSEDIKKSLHIREFNERDAIFKFFLTGKLDFYIDAQSDITDFFKKNAVIYQEKDFIRQTLLELKLFIVFTNDDKGRELASIFDRRMIELLKNGQLRKLYDKDSYNSFKYPWDF